ncbi:Insulin receptor [Orchesella cincta]|uniref:receptor protein-tyrosine kinase n=1 Tax=Orchesella cincta TaxID=48709 RepID=A0A1D2MRS1_ORCCI|nr:Insulin receptor [Orchesella cincta]
MTQWIWVHIVVATIFSVSSLILEANGQAQSRALVALDDPITGICQRKYIRNDPANLESLRKCKVIEGSLQIALVNPDSPEKWANLSFPDLREITGYVLLFDISRITTLRNLFPNLAVIRGQELIDTNALIINSVGLQEVGLPSLTDIQRGGVYILDNSQLCYVDTVDWNLIANETSFDGIARNKPSEQCPNTCKSTCPVSTYDGRHLCWSNKDCQKVFRHHCALCNGRTCTDHGECCSEQCLGGCNGTSPRDCYVCKHVNFNGTCTEKCPSGFYEYLQRRCVTRDECLNIVAVRDISKGSSSDTDSLHLNGKIYDSPEKKMCVLECPKDTELAPNKTSCVPCKGPCYKECPGTSVDSIEKARELAGCTRIKGVLKISIRRTTLSVNTGQMVKELKQNLDKIEEIDHYLVITHTYAIVSLDFLENLKVIRGQVLEDDKYAVVVRSNNNLMELWEPRPNRTIKIESKKAQVLFHYNPKLCPRKIWDFVAQSGIPQPKDDKIDIGITNGDKVTCNTQLLAVEIEKKTNNSVLIRYENFRRNLTLTSHLLSYEIHYKEAPDYPQKNISKYDDRDPCGEDDWTILEYPKISDIEVRGGIQNEPVWEHSRLIVNLNHYAWYALYVKTIVIPDENSLNNNTGAESNIIYFQTLPGVPSKPQEFNLAAGGPNTVTLSWTAPTHPNGELEKFYIWLVPGVEDQKQHDQRNHCHQGRVPVKTSSGTSTKPTVPPYPFSPSESVTISSKTKDPDCCSCSAAGTKTTTTSEDEIHYQDDMINQIMNHVFIASPDPPSDLNKQPDNNHVRLRRSLLNKRSVEEMGDNSGEKVGDTFPGEENSPGLDQPRVPAGMRRAQEIAYSPGVSKYTISLKNLTHFTMYKFGIQACRRQMHIESNATDVENDRRTCSDLTYGRIQTRKSPTADNIDPRTINTNITDGNILHLSWAEPPSPNGVVMAYIVKVQKWEGGKYIDLPITKCVTRKDFQTKRNFTFPDALHPGNYSVRIQVASLAQDSEWTADRYFIIEDTEGGWTGVWALVVLLPILLIITIGSLLSFYYIRTKGINYGRKIISANPEYMSNVDIPDEWEVPKDKLELLKELGQGSFGTVVEGILKDFIKNQPNMRCAVKTVSEDTSSEDRALFLREAALMVKLDCYHVVKLLGVVSKSQPTYVIMELMAKGDLRNYLRSRRPGTYNSGDHPPTLTQILRMAAEICDGMTYIHHNKLVHRDLAARNCMVGADLCVKVGDFGMTKEVIQSDYYRKQTRGLLPVRWMAPESLHDGVFTNQSDVWSMGCVLWEMATLAAQPYQGLSNKQVLEYVQSGRTMERPENCPDILHDLMSMCWRFDHRRRPSFIEILDILTPDLDPSFAQVSFYHSPEGLNYRAQVRLQSTEEDLITIRTPLRATFDAMSDDELDDYDSDENDLNHHIIDDLGDTPSRLLLSSPPTNVSVTSSSRPPPSLTNGLALNPLNIQPLRTDSNIDNINLANHTLPAPISTNPYSRSNYSPRPRTNSNNNNTNPRLPVSQNYQNNFSNVIPSAPTAGSSSSLSTTNYNSPIPNGVDSLVSNQYHASTSSPKSSVNPGDSKKVEQSKTNALNSENSDNSQALMINYPGDGIKISNGNGGNGGGNGYIIRKGSPINESQPVNRTTQC